MPVDDQIMVIHGDMYRGMMRFTLFHSFVQSKSFVRSSDDDEHLFSGHDGGDSDGQSHPGYLHENEETRMMARDEILTLLTSPSKNLALAMMVSSANVLILVALVCIDQRDALFGGMYDPPDWSRAH